MTKKDDLPNRPKLATFLDQRGLDDYAGGRLLGISGEYVRRLCLKFDNPRRARPTLRMRQKIAAATQGLVDVDDWDPPAVAAGSAVTLEAVG